MTPVEWVVGTDSDPKRASWSFDDVHAAMNFAHNDYRLIGKRIYVWRREDITYFLIHKMAR